MHEHHDCDMDWILGGDRVHNALLYIDGIDHFNSTATAQAKGWTIVSTYAATNPGRFGGLAMRGTNNGNLGSIHPISGTPTTVVMGFAYRPVTSIANRLIAYLAAGANGTLTVQIRTDATGHIIIQNSGGTTIATGTTVLVLNTWYYIELKAVIAGASGSCTVHLNGVSEIATTTGNFGSTGISNIVVYDNGGDYDDIYVLDTTGSAPNNDFLGDVRVVLCMPNADGAHTAWTPNPSGSHFSKVNEVFPPDGDTTYVSDATPGDIDTYVCDDVDGGATVYGVQVSLYARKDDASVRQIAPVVRQASTDYVGSTVTMSSTYLYYTQLYDKDPTGSAWTAANVNGDEFGVKEIA